MRSLQCEQHLGRSGPELQLLLKEMRSLPGNGQCLHRHIFNLATFTPPFTPNVAHFLDLTIPRCGTLNTIQICNFWQVTCLFFL